MATDFLFAIKSAKDMENLKNTETIPLNYPKIKLSKNTEMLGQFIAQLNQIEERIATEALADRLDAYTFDRVVNEDLRCFEKVFDTMGRLMVMSIKQDSTTLKDPTL